MYNFSLRTCSSARAWNFSLLWLEHTHVLNYMVSIVSGCWSEPPQQGHRSPGLIGRVVSSAVKFHGMTPVRKFPLIEKVSCMRAVFLFLAVKYERFPKIVWRWIELPHSSVRRFVILGGWKTRSIFFLFLRGVSKLLHGLIENATEILMLDACYPQFTNWSLSRMTNGHDYN